MTRMPTKQIHRVNPVQIDFKADGSPERIQHDRRRMLLHRLFDNRLQIASDKIENILALVTFLNISGCSGRLLRSRIASVGNSPNRGRLRRTCCSCSRIRC